MFGLDMKTYMLLVYGIFALIVALLTILMPFFILRIRNEAIKTNELLTEINQKIDGRHL